MYRFVARPFLVYSFRQKDFIDHFRGRFYKNAEYSKFAPVVSHVEPGHDAFKGRAHDKPVASTFKSDQHHSKVEDGFRGAVRDDYAELAKYERDAKVVSDPIPNLIANPEASLYIEPVGTLYSTDNTIGDVSPGYGLQLADQPHVLTFSPASVEPVPKVSSAQVYIVPPVFPSLAPAPPFVNRLPVADDSKPILQVFPSYVPASPVVNRLPVADNSNPSLDVSYQYAAQTTPSPKLTENAAHSSLTEQDQEVYDEYIFRLQLLAPIISPET